VIYKVSGVDTSFIEMMALPDNQLASLLAAVVQQQGPGYPIAVAQRQRRSTCVMSRRWCGDDGRSVRNQARLPQASSIDGAVKIKVMCRRSGGCVICRFSNMRPASQSAQDCPGATGHTCWLLFNNVDLNIVEFGVP
jgi:hypothetical protein